MWWTKLLSVLGSMLSKNNPNASNKINSANTISNMFKNNS